MLSLKRNGAPFLWNGCAVLAEYAQRACDIISIKLDSKKIASYVENIMSEILEAGNTVMKNIDNFMDEEGNVNVEEVRSAIQEERRKLKKR